MAVPALTVTRLCFDLTVTDPIVLPPYKGFAFRGVFGTVLRERCCVLPEEDCRRCPFRQTCVYACLFESSPLEGVEGFRRFSTFPRPYLIHPPLGDKRRFNRYDRLRFDLTLIGSAGRAAGEVISTFEEIGRRGIRGGDGRFLIDTVTACGDRGERQVIYQRGSLVEGVLPQRSLSFRQPGRPVPGVTLTFLTPLLLEEQGRIRFEPPGFSLLFEHLARRILLLQAAHGPAALPCDRLDRLEELARDITMSDSTLTWQSMERISNRQKARIKTGGLTGSITYRGELAPFIPWLKAGELVHIGKSTTFGFGRYRLQIRMDSEEKGGKNGVVLQL